MDDPLGVLDTSPPESPAKRWSWFKRRLRTVVGNSRAALLIETITAVTVLTTLASVTLVGMSTAQIARGKLERQADAETIARNQMEHLFTLPYQGPTSTYPAIASLPPNYSVTAQSGVVDGFESDGSIAKVVVTITHNGKEILVLETVRADD